MTYSFRISILLASTILTSLSCSDKPDQDVAAAHTAQIQEYDENLAQKLGADDYGMRRYIMAFLKAGPNRNQSEEEAIRLQRQHLDNIQRLAKEGTLVLAGPFLDDNEIRGIYVFAVESIEEARKLSETDPAIQAGRLVLELHPWYGSAALMNVNDLHSRISRDNP